jgi:alanine racemase
MVMVKALVMGMVVWRFQITEHHNVDYLGVAFADEGISLKNGGIHYQLWS